MIALDPGKWRGVAFWMGFVALAVPIVLIMAAAVRRLHDLDLSAMMAFYFSVIVRILLAVGQSFGLKADDEVGLVLFAAGGLYLAVAPGTSGDNDFGPARRAPG